MTDHTSHCVAAHMTPEMRDDFVHWRETGRVSAANQARFVNRHLIRVDEYGSLVITTTGREAYKHIKKGI